ncbi:MAG: hypothetical protein ACRDHP_07350, partial [Ktedonobacterales bacterium]
CATRRQVREYLHAAELDDLTSAEEARVAGIVNTIVCAQVYAHHPAAMPLPERPRILLGRESLVGLLTRGIEERPSGVYAITGMPGVGKSALAAESLHRLAAGSQGPSTFPAGMASFGCEGRSGIPGLLSLLDDIAAVFAPSRSAACRAFRSGGAGAALSAPAARGGAPARARMSDEARLTWAIQHVRGLLIGKRAAIFLDGVEPDFPWRRALAALRVWNYDAPAGVHAPADGHAEQLVLTTSHYIPPHLLTTCHIHVDPLTADAAVELFIRLLERPLTEEEYGSARRLCAALGHLPLAIQAAAAAVTTSAVPLAMLAEEAMRDPFAAVFGTDVEGSALLARPIDALSPVVRKWYAALSTLGSSFSVRGAEHHPLSFASTELASHDDLLAGSARTAVALGQLVQRSLLAVEATPLCSVDGAGSLAPATEMRYRFHPLLRASANARLARMGRRVTSVAFRRTQTYALEYIEQHPGDPAALEREADMLLAATNLSWRLREYDVLARLVSGLAPVLPRVTTAATGKRALWYGVQAARALDDRRTAALWLNDLGVMHYYQSELGAARQAWDAATELADAVGVLTHAVGNLATLADVEGEYTRALTLNARQRRRYEMAGDRFGLVFSQLEAGAFARRRGDAERAYAEIAGGLSLLVGTEELPGEGFALLALEARLEQARVQRDYSRAREYSQRACDLALATCTRYTVARFHLEQAEYAYA